jgi:hypothetical protein
MFTWRNTDCQNNHISYGCIFENGFQEGLMTQRASEEIDFSHARQLSVVSAR